MTKHTTSAVATPRPRSRSRIRRHRASSARPYDVHAALARFQGGTPTFADLALTAKELGVPAWTLLLEGLDKHPELCQAGGAQGLASVVENYLASDQARREEIEVVARASAALSRMPSVMVRS
jgi:hypothetical protein